MNTCKKILIVINLSMVLNIVVLAGEQLSVLPQQIYGFQKNEMMNHYLRRQVQEQFDNWKGEYERRKKPEQIADYQSRLREKFIEAIGGLPDRTPLNPRITGVVNRDGYKVEKVIFESQPKHYVTALLFMPDSQIHKPPYPGVLVPCGHAQKAKGYPPYQTMGALLALNGMAALVFDPIDQGERSQMPEFWPKLWGVTSHNMIGVGCILLGQNTARFEIWDGMRGIDYLQSRPEVEPKLIGCTGNSGGGTQTSYLMALDDRIIAAAPSCYITSFYERLLDLGAQDAEQNIFGQLAFGMDHADYLMMRAPTPILICAATKDYFDIRGTWSSFRYAKRLYTRLELAERIDLLENPAGHNYNRIQRQGVVRWMARWLLKKDEPITEPEIQLLTDEEFQCTPQGQVMLLEGAHSTYDLNRDCEGRLARHRKKLWSKTNDKEMLNRVCEIAGIRRLTSLPKPEVEKLNSIKRNGCHIEKLIIKPEYGIYLPALMFVPEQLSSSNPVLYLNEQGKAKDAGPEGPIEQFVKDGRIVLAVDLRGIGETFQTEGPGYFKSYFGSDGEDVYLAYLLGRSYVGMRAEDILLCTEYLRQQCSNHQVYMIAVGAVGIPALHAAAVEPEIFSSVRVEGSLISWSSVIELGRSKNQLANTVHGALTTYDLDNLAATLGGKLTIEHPLDALGEPIKAEKR